MFLPSEGVADEINEGSRWGRKIWIDGNDNKQLVGKEEKTVVNLLYIKLYLFWVIERLAEQRKEEIIILKPPAGKRRELWQDSRKT